MTNSDLGDGAVDGSKVLDNSLGTNDVATNSLFGSDIFDGTLTSADIGTSAVASSEIANGSIVSADIASHGIDQSRIDGTDHYGGIGVGGITSGRCTTVTISIGGAEAGDAGILTTDGILPDGEVMYLQRVLADSAQVKVCNLSGGDLPAVTVERADPDLPLASPEGVRHPIPFRDLVWGLSPTYWGTGAGRVVVRGRWGCRELVVITLVSLVIRDGCQAPTRIRSGARLSPVLGRVPGT